MRNLIQLIERVGLRIRFRIFRGAHEMRWIPPVGCWPTARIIEKRQTKCVVGGRGFQRSDEVDPLWRWQPKTIAWTPFGTCSTEAHQRLCKNMNRLNVTARDVILFIFCLSLCWRRSSGSAVKLIVPSSFFQFSHPDHRKPETRFYDRQHCSCIAFIGMLGSKLIDTAAV